ncbi:hypothetical protein [Kitasatospora viridis]|uniref:Uncharacterized protein n=1 Tax=Kitasatospora viridis TaxID=281105 RepID=A0A561SA94_9ACTN|nr:hypothetical protein [Kitasatospora viridis]TWF71767.1 hypothetical protein FHX73_18138 [Kitasatospora viridis]
MRRAVFPERSCRAMVGGEFQNYSCEVVEHHNGPCASGSVPASVTVRERWEEANPQLASETAGPEVWV